MEALPEIISFEGMSSFDRLIDVRDYSSIFVLCDENTARDCLPLFNQYIKSSTYHLITITAGESNKTLETCQFVWQELLSHQADRHSLLINLGGGVVGDLGGFCAATYMRGMAFVQLPTSLLAQVDASVGGKTGVDFQHYKNLIGVFNRAQATIIDVGYLNTLPKREYEGGYVEIWKHALIADQNMWQSLISKPKENHDILQIIQNSVAIKQNIVEKDPFEKGYRKALNFGHTIGHAFENLALSQNKDIRHGEAVAFGILAAARLSQEYSGLAISAVDEIDNIIATHCSWLPDATECEELIRLVKSDKKHVGDQLRFTLLTEIGSASIDQHVTDGSIKNSILHSINAVQQRN